MLPTRRTYAWLAAGVLIFAVYASLIPFNFRARPLGDAVRRFEAVLTSTGRERISRTNFLANLLLFLPVGFGCAGALLADRPKRPLALLLASTVTIAVSVTASVSVEFLQEFLPGRVPARRDVQAQTIGCLMGLIAWLAAGQPLTGWIRGAHARTGVDRISKALLAYAAIWALVNLAPFDITTDLGDLARRVRLGRIAIVPFSGGGRPLTAMVWDALSTTLGAVPLGALGALGRTGSGRRRGPIAAFAVGTGLVALIECAQVFISSHAADTTDLIFGAIGVAFGVQAGRAFLQDSAESSEGEAPRVRLWPAAALAAWCVVLALYHWMPYDFSLESPAIRAKIGRLSLVPFLNYARGSDLNAFKDLLVKLALSVPLGVIASFVSKPDGRALLPRAAWLALAAVVFTGIEAGQLFLPARSPDPTDVLVGVAGTAAGLAAGRWIVNRGRGTT